MSTFARDARCALAELAEQIAIVRTLVKAGREDLAATSLMRAEKAADELARTVDREFGPAPTRDEQRRQFQEEVESVGAEEKRRGKRMTAREVDLFLVAQRARNRVASPSFAGAAMTKTDGET